MIKSQLGLKNPAFCTYLNVPFFTLEGFDVNTDEAKWDNSYIVEYITQNTMFWW